MDDYLKHTGSKMADIRAQYKDAAYNTVKAQLVLEAVKTKEGIEVVKDELDQEIKKTAESMKKTVEAYKKELKPEELEYMQDRLAYDKTVNFLMEHAVLEAQKPGNKKEDGKVKKASVEKKKEKAAVESK